MDSASNLSSDPCERREVTVLVQFYAFSVILYSTVAVKTHEVTKLS